MPIFGVGEDLEGVRFALRPENLVRCDAMA